LTALRQLSRDDGGAQRIHESDSSDKIISPMRRFTPRRGRAFWAQVRTPDLDQVRLSQTQNAS
jgi:hypothetical protein